MAASTLETHNGVNNGTRAEGIRHKRPGDAVTATPVNPGGMSTAMSTARTMIDRFRQNRMISRQNRAIDRAIMGAPTQAMRDELAVLAQRRTL